MHTTGFSVLACVASNAKLCANGEEMSQQDIRL